MCLISKPWVNSTCSYSPETLNFNQNWRFLSRVTLKFNGWPWKTIDTFSLLLQALCIIWKPSINSNWSYSPEILSLGQNRQFIGHCDLEIWLYATVNVVHHFIAICVFQMELQTRNAEIGTKFVLTFVTLIFDLWPWPFTRTSLLSMVITPENFMMIQW